MGHSDLPQEPSADPHQLTGWWPLVEADDLRCELLAAWGEPRRGYHDLQHLVEVCARLDSLAAGGAAYDRTSVLVAAWFHDAVYAGAPDDEERSAQWAESALAGLTAVDGSRVDAAEVARLIRLTIDHRPARGDANGAALCDADLGILAASPARYQEYVDAVRVDFRDVPDKLFWLGRLAVLDDLAAKPTLFHTAVAREGWEAAARANLDAERGLLRQRIEAAQ